MVMVLVVGMAVVLYDPVWRELVELWQDRRPPAGLEPCSPRGASELSGSPRQRPIQDRGPEENQSPLLAPGGT